METRELHNVLHLSPDICTCATTRSRTVFDGVQDRTSLMGNGELIEKSTVVGVEEMQSAVVTNEVEEG